MKCPNCPDSGLVMTDRSGIEIDYCPICRGVWLDRGELDKIIERAGTPTQVAAIPVPAHAPQPTNNDRSRGNERGWKRDDDDDDDDRRGVSYDGYRPKKKKSLLGELFDF